MPAPNLRFQRHKQHLRSKTGINLTAGAEWKCPLPGAVLENVPTDALPLVAEHEGNLPTKVDRRRIITVRGSAVHPEPFLLQPLDRAGKIGHLRDWHPLTGPGRRL